MIVLLSPAKSIDLSPVQLKLDTTDVRFEKETQKLVNSLKKMNITALQKLMNVSENLAQLNSARYKCFSKNYDPYNSKPAVFTFNGDVYRGLDAISFTNENIVFAQNHLRILSGLYGLLRPLDKIQPYRLEMGTRLKLKNSENLYQFWGNKIFKLLKSDLPNENTNLINLASNEYYSAVKPYLKKNKRTLNIVNVKFLDQKNGLYKTIAFYAKKARGLMARYIVKNEIMEVNKLANFNLEGYQYDTVNSSDQTLIFRRAEQ